MDIYDELQHPDKRLVLTNIKALVLGIENEELSLDSNMPNQTYLIKAKTLKRRQSLRHAQQKLKQTKKND